MRGSIVWCCRYKLTIFEPFDHGDGGSTSTAIQCNWLVLYYRIVQWVLEDRWDGTCNENIVKISDNSRIPRNLLFYQIDDKKDERSRYHYVQHPILHVVNEFRLSSENISILFHINSVQTTILREIGLWL